MFDQIKFCWFLNNYPKRKKPLWSTNISNFSQNILIVAGISLALAHCIQELSLGFISKDNQIELQTVIQHTVDIATNIIIYMLDLLSGGHNTDTSTTPL